MQTLTLKQYGISVTYHNIPDEVAARAIKYNRQPIGPCACGRMGYLLKKYYYTCERCAKISRGGHTGSNGNEMDIYFVAGSNYHRRTGKYIPPQIKDEYDLPPNLSAALSD